MKCSVFFRDVFGFYFGHEVGKIKCLDWLSLEMMFL